MTTAEVKCSAQRKKGLVYKLHLRPVLSILVRRFSQLHGSSHLSCRRKPVIPEQDALPQENNISLKNLIPC
jgi:hypothetical protein